MADRGGVRQRPARGAGRARGGRGGVSGSAGPGRPGGPASGPGAKRGAAHGKPGRPKPTAQLDFRALLTRGGTVAGRQAGPSGSSASAGRGGPPGHVPGSGPRPGGQVRGAALAAWSGPGGHGVDVVRNQRPATAPAPPPSAAPAAQPRKAAPSASRSRAAQGARRGAASVRNPNALDASAASIVRRGKERKHPKPKRPTSVKLRLLREREALYFAQHPEQAREGWVADADVLQRWKEAEEQERSGLFSMWGAGDPAAVPVVVSGSLPRPFAPHGDGAPKLRPDAPAFVPRPAASAATSAGGSGGASHPAPAVAPAAAGVVRQEAGVASAPAGAVSGAAPAPPQPAAVVARAQESGAAEAAAPTPGEVAEGGGDAGTEQTALPPSFPRVRGFAKVPKPPTTSVRPYVDHDLCPELDEEVTTMVQLLIELQSKALARNPQRAKRRRRYVMGLRQVEKVARLGRAKCIVIAHNIDPSATEGGLDHCIKRILTHAVTHDIPTVFSMSRRRFAKVVGARTRISCLAVTMPDGAEQHLRRVKDMAALLRRRLALRRAAAGQAVAPESVAEARAREDVGLARGVQLAVPSPAAGAGTQPLEAGAGYTLAAPPPDSDSGDSSDG